jgi:hypothetical protein
MSVEGLAPLLEEIKNSPEFNIYYQDYLKFFGYLNDIQFKRIKASYSYPDGSISQKEWDIVYRWCDVYRASIMAKFYKLSEWFELSPHDISFVSLTASSTGRSIEDCFRILIKSRSKILRAVRHIIGHRFDYVWVFEPHPGKDEKHNVNKGYPHLHMIVFEKIDIDAQIRLRKLWERYEAGSFERGLEFDVRENQEKIRSLSNYLIKYISKTWTDTGSKYGSERWDKETFIFNMVAWKNQFRFWGASRNLSKVMAYQPKTIDLGNGQKVLESEIMPKECLGVSLYDTFDKVGLGEVWRADDKDLVRLMKKHGEYLKHLDKLSFFEDKVS